MKRFKKFLIALTSLFSVVALFPLSACNAKMHTLTLVNENEAGGSLTGSGIFKTGSQVTISYTVNKGYKFDKWNIDGETIKISSKAYTFKMPDKDITVKGNFLAKQYKLNIRNNNNCVLEGSGTYDCDSQVTVKCEPNKGFTFASWIEEADKKEIDVSNNSTYTFKMPSHDVTLKVKLIQQTYSATIILSNPEYGSARIDHSDAIPYGEFVCINFDFKYIGYDKSYGLEGLYLYENGVKGEKISDNNCFTMPDHDIVIFAQLQIEYPLAYSIIDEKLGAVYVSSWAPGDKEVVLTTLECEYFDFIGWYDCSNYECLTTELSYKFVMPTHSVRLTTRYKSQETSISFGEYPQTIVKDNDLAKELDKIDELNSRGYIEYQGNEYYRDSTSLGISPNSNIPSGELHTSKSTYFYFKVEPIKWYKINELNDGTSVLLSKGALTWNQLQESDIANGKLNYKNSSFRTYLNTTFYNNSFTSEEKNKIQKMSLSDCDTTNSASNGGYIEDKVFIPCRDDFDLPFFDSPFNYVLVAGPTTDYSYVHNKYKTYYSDTMFTNCDTCFSSYLLRDSTDKGQSICYFHDIENNYISDEVGIDISLRPMIFVKGL